MFHEPEGISFTTAKSTRTLAVASKSLSCRLFPRVVSVILTGCSIIVHLCQFQFSSGKS